MFILAFDRRFSYSALPGNISVVDVSILDIVIQITSSYIEDDH
jgi:hypothetical protein